ncbi:hypothetical protein C1645_766087 [Glomus cerebriforme]|uniref:Uncharacterized protein n=1 Tax=Glomus cerebriforme TaxID=658196 RepID=A0A397T1G2_9GLOM|nr:hypothetical protein C1645_766087 [Glomus cerebriforme]
MYCVKNLIVIFGFLLTIFPYTFFSFPLSPTTTVSTGCTQFAKLPYSNPNTITTTDSNVYNLPCEGSAVNCLLIDNVEYNITYYVNDGECVNGISSIWFYVIAQCEGYIWGGATSYETKTCFVW